MQVNQKANDIRRLVQTMESLSPDIHQGISDGTLSLDQQLEIGLQLFMLSKKIENALEPIKKVLRAEAVKRNHGLIGPCLFTSPDGSRCTVRVPAPTIQMRKDADIGGLKALLGYEFSELFEELISYKPLKDFHKRVGSCSPDKAKVLLGAVDITEGTPRVYFED